MEQLTIACPKCGAEIPLTETLAGPLLAQARQEMERIRERDVAAAREKATADAKRAAQEDVRQAAVRAESAEARAKELDDKLGAAQRAQAEAERKERELADEKRELDLTIERRVTESLAGVRQAARTEADEANRLKLAEAETAMNGLRTKLAEAQQKAEQGSQQLQGEVQELELEATLRTAFPHDEVGEVAKGVNGADCTQVVNAPSGVRCGLILWESKRTKRWSDAWLAKLREDGRRAQADLLVIVSAALPEEVAAFTCLDGVWVCKPAAAVPMAMALRATLLAAHNVRQVQAGMRTKSEEVYGYVTGPQFRRRVEALVEAFTNMTEDLAAERKAMERQWAKRAAQLERAAASTSGMFGDLQGIAGKALPEPAGLALGQGGGE